MPHEQLNHWAGHPLVERMILACNRDSKAHLYTSAAA
jgi:hypothetical protein